MTEFVESLKRLYQDKKVLKMEQLNKLLSDKKISKQDFEYIIRKEE